MGLLRIGTSCAFKDKQDMVGRVNYVHEAGESTTDHRENRTKVKYTEERQYSFNINNVLSRTLINSSTLRYNDRADTTMG